MKMESNGNRYLEVVEYILNTFTAESINKFQKNIASFLEFAKRDDFWRFIDRIRKVHKIKIEIYDQVIKKTINGDYSFWKKYFEQKNQEERTRIDIYLEKRESELIKKSSLTINEQEELAFLRLVQTCLITCPSETVLDSIKSSIDAYIGTFGIGKKYSCINEMILHFALFDMSCIKFDIVNSAGGFKSVQNGVAIINDSDLGPVIRIFKNTSIKQLRKAFSDDDFKMDLEFMKQIAPDISPIAKQQKNYNEKLMIEFERADGKKYSEILTKKTDKLDSEEILDLYAKANEKKELDRLRQLHKRSK